MDPIDADLVDAAADGDERAFGHLVDRHYDACLRYAVHMLGNRPDAEDAVQETFLRAYRSLGSYREHGRFRGWLFRILVNRCRSAARVRSRWQWLTGESADVRGIPTAGSPDSAVMGLAAVERALGCLPESQREAFLLKYVEEWTYEEMAEFIGASVSALKMRVARARHELRNQLSPGVTDDGS